MANIILIDPRTGSKELLPYFTKGRAVVSDYELPADFQFFGNGQDGVCTVGIERKRTSEFITDYDRFAANQLVKLINCYTFRFLIIEGPYQPTPDAHIEVWENNTWNNRMHNTNTPLFKTMIGREFTLILLTHTHILHTVSQLHTALTVEGLYNWFQKGWHEHTSFNVEYTAPPSVVMPRTPTIMEKMLVQIERIGWQKAIAVAARYPNMEVLCAASVEDVANVELAKVGDKQQHVGMSAAKSIKRFINGRSV